MTDCYYEKVLKEACKLLLTAVISDHVYVNTEHYPDKTTAFDVLADSYVKYTQIANKLNKCYQEMKLPHIRTKLQKLWEMVLARLLEIKHEMVDMEKSDFQFLDNAILANNITRWDLELDIPEDYRIQRKEQLDLLDRKFDRIKADEERRRLEEALERGELEDVDDVIIMGRMSDLSDISGFETPTSKLSKFSSIRSTGSSQEAKKRFVSKQKSKEEKEIIAVIQIIQKHERARVVRLKIQIDREYARLKEDIDNLRYVPIPDEKKAEVARIIQRHWRRYRNRRKANYIRDQRRLLMDLYVPAYFERTYPMMIEQLQEERRKHQLDNIRAIEDVAFIYRMRMERKKEVKQGDLELELMDYIREWYEITKLLELPNIPDWPGEGLTIPPFGFLGLPKKMPEDFIEEQNLAQYDVLNQLFGHDFDPLVGSELITAGHWVPPALWVEIKKAFEEYKASKKKKKPKKKPKKEKKDKEKPDPAWYRPQNSDFIDELLIKARESWFDYCEGTNKFTKQGGIWETEGEIDEEINRAIRLAADANIREHLEFLKTALTKGKKKKKKKEKKSRERKEAVEKIDKGDLTHGMESWQLFEMMVKNEMIRKYDHIMFKDLEGQYAFKNHELRRQYKDDPPASLGDLYQVIKEYCIFPLANANLRNTSPLIQSVLFVGPKYYTDPIVDAICTETGSVLFYLNPLEVADKLPPEMVEHLFIKAPKLFEPAVIHLDGAEKPYYKKEPSSESLKQPKFLARILPKIIGYIQQTERVLVIGTAEKPWEATTKSLVKIFAKIIPIPDLDFFYYTKIWRESLMKYHGVNRGFDYPTLAMLSKGIKTREIENAVENLMTTDRILSLKYNPLKIEEFHDILTAAHLDRSHWTWAQDNIPTFKARKKMLKKEIKREKKLKEAAEKEKAKKHK